MATASADGEPSVRMVLLKSADERGFAFFTNYGSAKAHDLIANPRAVAAVLLGTRPPGAGQPGPPASSIHEESDAYWRSRPRGSQLGAWASRQSEVITDRAQLERRLAEAGRALPRRGAAAGVLGRVPGRTRDRRVLAPPGRPAARPAALPAGGRRLGHRAAVTLSSSMTPRMSSP